MFGINQRKVKTLAKWYAREKGKNLEDYIVSLGPKSHVYNLPDDFINYVKEQLSSERKKPDEKEANSQSTYTSQAREGAF